MHKNLRKTLLKNVIIKQILIFPSKFFPGVSFGYSNLSIITFEKTADANAALNNTFDVFKGFQFVEELPQVAYGSFPSHVTKISLNQRNTLNNKDSRFLIDDSGTALDINKISTSLGDIANIVTGFYSGDNLRFIRAKDKSVRGAKKYDVVDMDEVTENANLSGTLVEGKTFIPYIKSIPKERYIQGHDEWFVKWDSATIHFYQSNKKSRFQNSQFYFQKGIAIPMVKAASVRACLMENRVFDQAIVGIFPHQESMLYYLLAYMNSDIACKMIHIINPTANNSSNYVKQLPFIFPRQAEVEQISNLVRQLLSSAQYKNTTRSNALHKQINKYFDDLYISALTN